MKNRILQNTKMLFSKAGILIGYFGVGVLAIGSQSIEAQIVAPKTYLSNHFSGENKPQKEDWILDGQVSSDLKSVITCGFTGGDPLSNHNKTPVIMKYSLGLSKIITKSVDFCSDENNNQYECCESYLEAITESPTELIAVGTTRICLNGANHPDATYREYKPLLVRIDKATGALIESRVFLFSDPTLGGYFFTCLYYEESGNKYIYAAGTRDKTLNGIKIPYICKININSASSTISTENYLQRNGVDFSGDIKSICFVYSNGSNEYGAPVVSGQAPSYLAVTGKYEYTSNGNTVSDVIIRRMNLDFSGQISKEKNSDGFATYKTGVLEGRNGPCPSLTSGRNSYDFGTGIIQLSDGKLAVAQMWNLIFLNNSQLCTDQAFREQLLDADGIVEIWDPSFSSSSADKTAHLIHLSGDDYEFRVAQDYDGNILLSGTTADDNKVQQTPVHLHDMYIIAKYNKNITASSPNIWWRTVSGDQGSHACGFDFFAMPSKNYIGVGNNHLNGEDFDLFRLGKECQSNLANQQFTPNVTALSPKPGYDNDVDFSLEHWYNTKPGGPVGPKQINVGGSGVVGARIIVEDGFTLRFLGGMGVNLQFPRVQMRYDIDKRSSHPSMNIVVKPGGKVIIENGVTLQGILGDCESNWEGIQLEAATAALPGGALIMGSGEIKNAICAIRVKKDAKVIIGSNSGGTPTFTNCHKSLEFLEDNGSNASIVIGAKFQTLVPLVDNQGNGHNAHVTMWNTHGIQFLDCIFENSYTGAFENDYRGIGIAAFDAHFFVMSKMNGCIPTGSGCRFTGLGAGIDAAFSTTVGFLGFPIKVLQATFENCTHGIHFGYGNNLVAYNNTFSYTNQIRGKDPIYGISGYTTGISSYFTGGINYDENKTFVYDEKSNAIIENIRIIGSSDIFTLPSTAFKNQLLNFMPMNGLGDPFIYGKVLASNNNDLDMFCNTYDRVHQGWEIQNGSLKDQGSTAVSATNKFAQFITCGPGGGAVAAGEAINNNGVFLNYFQTNTCNTTLSEKVEDFNIPWPIQKIKTDPLLPSTIVGTVVNSASCSPISPCAAGRWSPDMGEKYSLNLENLPPEALNIEREPNYVLDIFRDIANGNFTAARKVFEIYIKPTGENGKYKLHFNYLDVITDVYATGRIYNLSEIEINKMKVIVQENNQLSHLAAEFLWHTSGIPISESFEPVKYKTANLLAIKETIKLQEKFASIVSNPVAEEIQITIKTANECTYQLIDINGKEIVNGIQQTANLTIDVRHVAGGIYFLKLMQNNKVQTEKIVIQ